MFLGLLLGPAFFVATPVAALEELRNSPVAPVTAVRGVSAFVGVGVAHIGVGHCFRYCAPSN